MIISASYRTDIPAFYARWFENRLDAGHVSVRNPYSKAVSEISLRRGDVTGFVFWTRNAAPFAGALNRLRDRGDPFYLSVTITGYSRRLETATPPHGRMIAQLHDLASAYGPRAAVWRYDPILIGEEMTPSWHEKNFSHLAAALAGACDEVVISFAQIYRKTRRRLAGFDFRDPDEREKRELLSRLAPIARANGMTLSVCTQPHLLIGETAEARCIDAGRLSDIAGARLEGRRKGHRDGCACFESRDIGAYDSCPHGCRYCYAVNSDRRARARHKQHDPHADLL